MKGFLFFFFFFSFNTSFWSFCICSFWWAETKKGDKWELIYLHTQFILGYSKKFFSAHILVLEFSIVGEFCRGMVLNI